MVDYRLTLIPLLLDAGASVEGISIFDAVRSGSPELLQKVIDAGADVNATDVYRNSPLHISRVPEITRMLIERGANVHATNSRGQTPLVYTVQRLTNDENVQVLLDAGASSNGLTIFDAVRFPSLLQKFISDGANVNATYSHGRTPLLQALYIYPDLSNYSHFRVINAEVVKMLIDAGAKVNVTDSQGLTPLLQALINRKIHAEVVKMLIDAGAKVNVTDSQGRTPLRFALMNNGSVKKLMSL